MSTLDRPTSETFGLLNLGAIYFSGRQVTTNVANCRLMWIDELRRASKIHQLDASSLVIGRNLMRAVWHTKQICY